MGVNTHFSRGGATACANKWGGGGGRFELSSSTSLVNICLPTVQKDALPVF